MKFFGVVRLEKPADWEKAVGARNWKKGRSAFELAHAWHRSSGFPPKVRRLLESQTAGPLRGLKPEYGMAEMPVHLDTLKGPSFTDLMVYCRNADASRVVIATEGKVDESFGPIVAEWVRDGGEIKKSRKDRLDFLSAILRKPISPDSRLRYQLLHRTASAVLEGEKAGAAAAVVLVHSFGKSEENEADWRDFLALLGLKPDGLAGPVLLGSGRDLPVSFGWVKDHPGSVV